MNQEWYPEFLEGPSECEYQIILPEESRLNFILYSVPWELTFGV